ncbi:MAG: hypothetical protein EA427_16575 [Spirochaetaceae bacterium]|nr:MAG: hypothetical protein EA427_16575 [Spirochaetaceae bacterium]
MTDRPIDPGAAFISAGGYHHHIGLELYRDRPETEWPRTPDGALAMFTRSLDLNDLLAEREQ